MERWQPRDLLITLGEHGMLLFGGPDPPRHIPTCARTVFDVSGAGDTAIAVFTLALASGGTALEAANLANVASGVVVGKLGTAAITPAELLSALGEVDCPPHGKLDAPRYSRLISSGIGQPAVVGTRQKQRSKPHTPPRGSTVAPDEERCSSQKKNESFPSMDSDLHQIQRVITM